MVGKQHGARRVPLIRAAIAAVVGQKDQDARNTDDQKQHGAVLHRQIIHEQRHQEQHADQRGPQRAHAADQAKNEDQRDHRRYQHAKRLHELRLTSA